MDISKLLCPKSIAIVGASEKEGFGGDTCRNILDYADLSRVYLVNPKRDTVFGKKCYPSLSDLPENIDLVVLCTPRPTVSGLLRDAAAKGAGGAVVYASGYAETGTSDGKKAEQELKELCTELNIALMGPNCGGFINYVDKVVAFAFVSEKRERSGSVGIVSQSGQLCLSLMDTTNMRFSYSISAGNSSVVSMEDYLQYLVDDEHTKVIGLYMEGVSQPAKFVKALKAAAIKRKPVVVLKAGRSEKGSQVAASHTGSLAGADKMYDAIFKKFGVIRVNDVEELRSMTYIIDTLPALPQKTGVAAMSLSGGETGICADIGDMFGIKFPDFATETTQKLRALLPAYATPANPLDTTAAISYDANTYASALQAVMDDPSVDLLILGYTLLLDIADPCIHYMYKGIEQVVQNGRCKPILMLPFLENSRNVEYQEKLRQLGVPILPPPLYAFEIINTLLKFISYAPLDHSLELALPDSENFCASSLFTALSESESASMLERSGIAVPKGQVTASATAAIKIAESLGFPVVMKIASADIPHKSDMGGVALNITNSAEAEKAFLEIMANAKRNAPSATIDGVLVQKMLKPGLQCIIGVSNDPQFGPAVLAGLGGIFVEVFNDTILLPVPFTAKEALAALKSLKGYKLFTGYRGEPKLDVKALAETMANVSTFADTHRNSLIELDINPVFVYPEGQGVCAADALVVLRKQ